MYQKIIKKNVLKKIEKISIKIIIRYHFISIERRWFRVVSDLIIFTGSFLYVDSDFSLFFQKYFRNTALKVQFF